uniref:C-type lectin domain-containing protein n=1 Tax=Poecilia reticulata TaxID=8081 RepID=A0A3P9NM55_POERE
MTQITSIGFFFSFLKFEYSNKNYLMDCQLYEFHYINENKTWTEAQQYCREKHTDLVTVTNMKNMKRLINMSSGDINEAWIGLYDQTYGNRKWFWSLPAVEFNESETNWATGEPNGGYSCVVKTRCLMREGNGLYIRTSCKV